MNSREYHDASLDDVRDHLTPPGGASTPPINWEEVGNWLNDAELYPIEPEIARKLGELANGLSRHEKQVKHKDGTTTVEHSYSMKDAGGNTKRVDTTLGDRLLNYKPLIGPVEPKPKLMSHVKSIPGLYESVEAWLRTDVSKNPRQVLDAKLARRKILREISDAQDSGILRHRIAQSLPEYLDAIKARSNPRLKEKRLAAEEEERKEKAEKPYSFKDYLDETTYTGATRKRREEAAEQRRVAEGRYRIALQTGLIHNTTPTRGNNSHRTTFEALLDEESWGRMIKSAGDKFLDFVESSGGYTNTSNELRSRYVRLLKLEGETGIDVSDDTAVAESLDDDKQWRSVLSVHGRNFARYVNSRRITDTFHEALPKMLRSINPQSTDYLIKQYKKKLVREYRKMLKDGRVMNLNTTTPELIALQLIKSVSPEFDIPVKPLSPPAPLPTTRFGRWKDRVRKDQRQTITSNIIREELMDKRYEFEKDKTTELQRQREDFYRNYP